MTLHEYLEANNLTQVEFAARVGRTQGAVSQWLLGKTLISAESAIAIERATSGAVPASQLRPDIFAASAA